MEKNEPNFPPYMNMNYDSYYDPMMGDNYMFNPVIQYEQAYMYYRYLTQQLEYKIKCKEYEKLSASSKNERRPE